jgi:hypothetical protein
MTCSRFPAVRPPDTRPELSVAPLLPCQHRIWSPPRCMLALCPALTPQALSLSLSLTLASYFPNLSILSLRFHSLPCSSSSSFPGTAPTSALPRSGSPPSRSPSLGRIWGVGFCGFCALALGLGHWPSSPVALNSGRVNWGELRLHAMHATEVGSACAGFEGWGISRLWRWRLSRSKARSPAPLVCVRRSVDVMYFVGCMLYPASLLHLICRPGCDSHIS